MKDREVGLLAFGIALGSVLGFYLIPIVREELAKAQTLIDEIIVAIILVFILTFVMVIGLALANEIYKRF